MSIYNVNKAMGMIDADLIEAAVYPSGAEAKKTKTAVFAPKPWMKWAAAAAVFVVVVAGALVALNVTGAWRSGGVADPNGSGDEHSGVIISSDSGSVDIEDGSISTDYGTNYPPVPASDSPRTDPEPPDPSLPHGGDDRIRLTNYKYLDDRFTSIRTLLGDYIIEKTGKDIQELHESKEWYTDEGIAFSLMEVIDELGITKERFIELNNAKIEALRAKIRENSMKYPDYPAEEREKDIFRHPCFTDEEIDIIYSGDKKRIAEAFANPYAVIADDWEIYPLRWIIDNPASAYKDRHISLDALETAVNKLVEKGEQFIAAEDSAALLARVEEYRKLQ